MGLRTGCFHGEPPTCDSGLGYYKVGKNEENGTSKLEFGGLTWSISIFCIISILKL